MGNPTRPWRPPSTAKEIATLATTTKEKPGYENMVKHYIVASVLLGSMLVGHAHAVTAPRDAGLRKLQQDNYGDWYDPYGVDTDDDYYASNDGYFYRYPSVDSVTDSLVDAGGNTWSSYIDNDSVDSVTDSLVDAGGNTWSSY